MKTTLIVLLGILSIILCGVLLTFFLVTQGNIIEDGSIDHLPISIKTATYLHLISFSILIFDSFAKRTKRNLTISLFSILTLPNLIAFVTLILFNPQLLKVTKTSFDFLSNWNLSDPIFYLFVYIKTILSIF
ncbi:hypothetical protein [Leptospira perdikensis]|uniref:Uncharacterized protein n=1 Tax=Leptospira perdikensis TaxID=2484948 RepID=A0A4R9JJN7_9LEPT|nr:hypothetical protein [Leptospira perdikensis]TGL44910.1 hypothetical protein EHQ49_05470 [Leptospira perdikensis]